MDRKVQLFEIRETTNGKLTYWLDVSGLFSEDIKPIMNPYCMDCIIDGKSCIGDDFDNAINFFDKIIDWFKIPTLPQSIKKLPEEARKRHEETFNGRAQKWQSEEWRKDRIGVAKQLMLYFEHKPIIMAKVKEYIQINTQFKSCQISFQKLEI